MCASICTVVQILLKCTPRSVFFNAWSLAFAVVVPLPPRSLPKRGELGEGAKNSLFTNPPPRYEPAITLDTVKSGAVDVEAVINNQQIGDAVPAQPKVCNWRGRVLYALAARLNEYLARASCIAIEVQLFTCARCLKQRLPTLRRQMQYQQRRPPCDKVSWYVFRVLARIYSRNILRIASFRQCSLEFTNAMFTVCPTQEKGQGVYAKWDEDNIYYPARVAHVLADEMYTVVFDDGVERSLPRGLIIVCGMHIKP